MRIIKTLTAVLFCAMLLGGVGCGDPKSADAAMPAVKVKTGPNEVVFHVANTTKKVITEVAIHGDLPVVVSMGSIGAGKTSTMKGSDIDMPRRVYVSWTNYKKQRFDQSVQLPARVKKRYSGGLRFTVTARNTVKVSLR